MKKMVLVAKREFRATVETRAFILSMVLTPILMGLLIFVMPRLMQKNAPKIEGDVCIVDPTGEVAQGLVAFLKPEQIAARREQDFRKMQDAMPPALRQIGGSSAVTKAAVDQAFQKALAEVPRLRVVSLEPGADLEAAKAPLKDVSKDNAAAGLDRLAVIVVHSDAVALAAGKDQFGSYDLYVRGKLDDRVIDEITNGMRDAIIDARFRVAKFDRKQIDKFTRVDKIATLTVTATGENTTNKTLNMLLPAAFMGLLLMSVMTSGTNLLTTTVEEKTNRVVEVLLSALSPMELMVGKIVGQMGVGLIVLALYMGLGLLALISFAALGMVDPVLIVFMLVFYLLSYLTFGAFMAAIGSAVNEMREAQGLMMPVMLVIMVPWILWLPISRDPNSVLAVTLSFLPPVSGFVMMLRMASLTPPPIWQPLLAIVVGAAGGYASLWFAAKVFRIGLLMYGKPPSLSVLIRWARSA